MSDTPLISVIVPVYKVEPYLKRCIESIVQQTYKNLEIILIDDGSPDFCGVICDEYAKRDNRIRVVHKENGGLSSARNAGLDIAQGTYISFVDSDDYVHPKMLELLYEAIDKQEDTISVCDYCFAPDITEKDAAVFFSDVVSPRRIIITSEEFMELAIIRREYHSVVWNKLFPRKLFLKENVRFIEGMLHEDIMVTVQLVLNARRIVQITEPLYIYTQRKDSIMHNISVKEVSDVLDAYVFETDYLRKRGLKELSSRISLHKLNQVVFRYIDYKEKYPENYELRCAVHKRYRKMYWQAFPYLNVKEKLDRLIYYIRPELHNRITMHTKGK